MMSEDDIWEMRNMAWKIANDRMSRNEKEVGLKFTGVAQACEQILGIKDWGLLE